MSPALLINYSVIMKKNGLKYAFAALNCIKRCLIKGAG